MASAIPSPLPFIVSLLPHLLSSSDPVLPSSSLSSLVRYRHQFLHPAPDALPYLQAQAIRPQDQELAQIVEDRRQQLVAQFGDAIEEAHLGPPGYSFEKHEEGRLTARIALDERLQVLVSWEKDSSAAGAVPENGSPETGEELESDAWHYEDLQLYKAAEKGWHPSVHDAAASMLQASKAGSSTSSPPLSSVADGAGSRARAGSYLPAHLDRKEEIVQMEGSDGNIMGDDDYWDGVYSSDEDNDDDDRSGGGGARTHGAGKAERDESQYWQAYALQESMIPDTPAPDTPATSSPALSSPQVKTAAIQEEVPKEEVLPQLGISSDTIQANGTSSKKSPRDAAIQTSIRGLYDLFLLSSDQDDTSDAQQKQDAFLSLVKSAISSS